MTDEETKLSIDYLRDMQEEYIEGEGYERHPLPEWYALDYAIKVLEQQSCEDCISREDALMALTGIWTESRDEILSKAIRRINSLPPVTPKEKTRWIPVSERLPETNVEVLVTTEWDFITIGEMFSSNDWFIHEGATNVDIDDIKAWMPLPELYKPESEV